jgi:hypothetical protein
MAASGPQKMQKAYLEAVRRTLEAAMGLGVFNSQVVERHEKPEVELKNSKEVCATPVVIAKNAQERVLIEASTNSLRFSMCIKQSDAIEKILVAKFVKFMKQRAEEFHILRKKPVPGYDISFLITHEHIENFYARKLVDFIISFMEEIDKEVNDLKLSINARARITADDFLRRFN